MTALRGLALLLLAQMAGEVIAKALAWPLPGPVIGLVLLLVGLRWRPLREPVRAAADLLLAHFSLLFVPVGVGVITHLQLLAQHRLALLVILVVSTWVGLGVTALTLNAFLRRAAPRHGSRVDG